MATARFLERVVAQRPMPIRLVVASSMSIYGEGEYQCCASTVAWRPGPRPEEQLLARVGARAARAAARELHPIGTTESQAADPDVDLRGHQARSRGDVPRHRRRLRHPDRRAALLQRLRARPGALESVHRRGRDLRLAPAERQRPPIDLRGRPAVARLHPRVATSSRASCSRSSPRAPSGHAVNLGTGRPTTVARGRQGHRGRDRARHRAGASTSSTAPATSATASPTPTRASELLGFEAQVVVRGRHARADRLARGAARGRPRRRRHERARRPRPDEVGRRCRLDDTTCRSSSSRRTRRAGSSRACARCSSTPATRTLDVVVVDNGSTDGTRELVETQVSGGARRRRRVNHGFAHANNRGAMTCDARYVLFLNPDTEIVDGTFGELVAAMDARPEVGLAGVRQLTADGDAVADDPLLPERRRAARRGAGVGAVAAPPAGPASASSTSTVYDARGRVRLDVRLVHVRAPRGAAGAPACWTSGSSSTPRSRTSACGCCARAGGPAPPRDDDRPPRGQGRRPAAR